MDGRASTFTKLTDSTGHLRPGEVSGKGDLERMRQCLFERVVNRDGRATERER